MKEPNEPRYSKLHKVVYFVRGNNTQLRDEAFINAPEILKHFDKVVKPLLPSSSYSQIWDDSITKVDAEALCRVWPELDVRLVDSSPADNSSWNSYLLNEVLAASPS